jgi:tetratricopeptide (TPR) repeat protein
MLLAKALLCMGDTETAESIVIDAIEAMERIGDVTYLDEVLRARAEIAYSKGDRDSAVALLGKAKAAAPDYKKHELQFLADAIAKPGTAVSFT